MLKRIVLLTTLLIASSWSTLKAQDTNAAAATGIATTNSAAATNAAPAEPKPDPSGTATGAASDAADAGGNTFVVTEPTALTDEDKKDAAKVKSYAESKKA